MPRKGFKTITVPENEHEAIKIIADEHNMSIQDVVLGSVNNMYNEGSAIVCGIDLNLILEDMARLTRRVAELENQLEMISKHGKRTRDHNVVNNNKDTIDSNVSVFGQGDKDMTDEQAIMECMLATPVTSDPLQNISFISTDDDCRTPRAVKIL